MSSPVGRVRKAIAAPLTLVLVIAIASQISPSAAAAAWHRPVPKDVKGIKVQPVVAKPRPAWTASGREFTAKDVTTPRTFGGEQTVDLATTANIAGRGRQAGRLPVFVAPASESAAAPGRVRVKYVAHTAGFGGPVLELSRADAVTSPGQAKITIDYRSLAGVFNSDARTRLRLVNLADGTPIASTNDVRAGTVSATLAISGTATAVGLAAAPAGPDGDYTATSLAAASTWQVSQQTGAFTWAYPIKLPTATGSLAPSVSLSYNSAAIDGRTAATNTQGSWVGDGWSMWPGFIERTYQGCSDDKDTPGKKNPNNTGVNGGDLCYFDDNATVSLNGSSAELVKVANSYSGSDDKNVQYRGTADDGSLIEMIKDGRSNGDADGTYWRETTADGTQYYFGRDSGQGGSSAGTDTNSVFTAPIYSNNPDEPGYDADFAKSRNTRGWRWNLDYVVDRNGNTITYYYGKETGAYAREGDQDKRITYDRGGYLKRIEYSSRSGDAATVHPGARVEFRTDDRCVGTCYDSGNKPVANAFPDTPWEQYCDAAPCTTQFSPTFWTQNRLSRITTQVYSGTGDGYTDVDSWTLDQTYLSAGGNEGSPMWLKSIVHKGLTTSAGGPAVTDPPVVFNPNADLMPNRVDSTTDGHSSLYRDRIQTVTTESGAQIGVTYSAKECTRNNLPKPWNNTMRCFPQYYGADGETPKLDWFHKYLTTRVDIYDETGGFSHQQTNYDYLDKPAWAYDNSKLIKPNKRTWGQFRGYGDVRVRQGLETGVQSATQYRYFRGMDGDKQPNANGDLPPTGTPRSVSISDAYGSVADHLSFAGTLREQIVTNGPGGDWVSGTVNTPEHLAATAVDGPLSAWPTHISTTRNRLKLSSGQTRWTSTQTAYDDLNYPKAVNDLGDEAIAADDRCSTLEYTRNLAANILGTVKRTQTVSLKCGATPTSADVLADTRTYFDDPDAYGKAPTRGLAVRVDELGSWKGSDPQFVTTQKTVYDDLGRPSSATDALGHITKTAFTPATSGPVTKAVVTDPLGRTMTTTLDRNLGVPLTTSDDANGAVTELKYDGDGRLLAYWAAGRSSTANPDEPNATFAYRLRNGNAPTAVTTKTLTGYASKTYRTSITLFDGLLRKRQTQTQTVNGGRAILDTLYDSRGLVASTSNPYYDYTNAPPSTTLVTGTGRAEVPATTQNVYDGAGRLTDAIFELSGTEQWRSHTTYAGEKVSVTPPKGGITATTITDARGRTTQLRQYKDPKNAGSDTAGTYDLATYSYNKQGLQSKIVDQAGNTWTFGYDVRGRLTSTTDPDKGPTTSTYDPVGQLSTSTNAGHTLAYTYDNLGRKTGEHKGTADGPLYAKWTYDDLPHGVGKPSQAIRYDPPGSTNAYITAITGYDSGGRATGTTVTVPSTEAGLCVGAATAPCSYTAVQKYKVNGDPAQTKLPAIAGLAQESVSTIYNPVGLVDGVIGVLSAGNQLYDGNTYNQFDQLIGQTLGADVDQVYLINGFDEQTGRMNSFQATPRGKADIYHQTYTHDNAGNVTAITDKPDGGQTAEAQCFTYDYLNRITEAWTPTSLNCATTPTVAGLGGSAKYWQSFTFDTTGNRKTEIQHGTTDIKRTYLYPASGSTAVRPHAVTQIQTTNGTSTTVVKTENYAYDQAGNTTCRPALTTGDVCPGGTTAAKDNQVLTWDDEGHLAKTTDKTGDTTYVYDANGNRLIRKDPAGSTLYLQGGTELRKPKTGAATATRYYTASGNTIATRTPTSLTWMVNDNHGTGTATVSNDGKLTVNRQLTLPFGANRGTNPTAWVGDKGFVGGTKDNTGLTHLGAREYDPVIGKFISVDPIMDTSSPASWNGYAYAGNNPVGATDANGLSCRMEDGSQCGPTKSKASLGGDGGNNGSAGKLKLADVPVNIPEGLKQVLPDWDYTSKDYTVGSLAEFAAQGDKYWQLVCGWLAKNIADECSGSNPFTARGSRKDRILESGIMSLLVVGTLVCGLAIEVCAGLALEAVAGEASFAGTGSLMGATGFATGVGGIRTLLGGACSFSQDTEVLMADGSKKPFKDLEVGDVVLAADPQTGEQAPQAIEQVWTHNDDLYVLTVDGQRLVTTEDHPFWNETDQAWEEAQKLHPGDLVRTPTGVARVNGFNKSSHSYSSAYNLTVADLHTYYVMAGTTPVLVHNASCGPLTAAQQTDIAKYLGYNKLRGNYGKANVFEVKKPGPGQPRYISRDIDQHNGGVFKGANKIEDLWSKDKRTGTYDVDIVDGEARGLRWIGE